MARGRPNSRTLTIFVTIVAYLSHLKKIKILQSAFGHQFYTLAQCLAISLSLSLCSILIILVPCYYTFAHECAPACYLARAPVCFRVCVFVALFLPLFVAHSTDNNPTMHYGATLPPRGTVN